jgi:intein/homing endonuclease
VGDYLIKEDGTEVEIISKILETGYYTVYKLDVEENDLFIANGLITHNAKGIEV